MLEECGLPVQGPGEHPRDKAQSTRTRRTAVYGRQTPTMEARPQRPWVARLAV